MATNEEGVQDSYTAKDLAVLEGLDAVEMSGVGGGFHFFIMGVATDILVAVMTMPVAMPVAMSVAMIVPHAE